MSSWTAYSLDLSVSQVVRDCLFIQAGEGSVLCSYLVPYTICRFPYYPKIFFSISKLRNG